VLLTYSTVLLLLLSDVFWTPQTKAPIRWGSACQKQHTFTLKWVTCGHSTRNLNSSAQCPLQQQQQPAAFESRRQPSEAKHRAGRTAVPSSCCDAVPIRREALQRRNKYDAILCSLLGGYEDVWLNNLQLPPVYGLHARLLFYARTWQQRANREDRISAVHSKTGSESLRNAHRCANCENQINEQQSHFVFPCRGSSPVYVYVPALPPALEVALCRFSQSFHSNWMSAFLLRYTLVSRSVGSPQQKPSKAVSCLRYRHLQIAIIATFITCLGLSEKLSHMRDTNEECLVQQLSSCDICWFTVGQEGHR